MSVFADVEIIPFVNVSVPLTVRSFEMDAPLASLISKLLYVPVPDNE